MLYCNQLSYSLLKKANKFFINHFFNYLCKGKLNRLNKQQMGNDFFVIGVDFGSDSVRCLIADADTGKVICTATDYYTRWRKRLYCNPSLNIYRQHPLDYIESFERCVKEALIQCSPSARENIKAISFDTTASTPVITDCDGIPLALCEGYEEDPDAMFILWKDHSAIEEADAINELAHSQDEDYTAYSGGSYSCEWAWAKVLHILRTNEKINSIAYSFVEHCEWMSALLTGNVNPGTIRRSRCVAGHKEMWNAEWGGYPPSEFFSKLNPGLGRIRNTIDDVTYTCDKAAGTITGEWAARLGLSNDVIIGIGGADCHVGAIGAGITPGVLVKVIGTSTCDIAVIEDEQMKRKKIKGICGQVDGSVIPGCVGIEAGQSAFGDIFAWYNNILNWKSQGKADPDNYLPELNRQAALLPLTEDDMVATDWFNGRRSPNANLRLKATLSGITLSTTAVEIYKALVEAAAFGSRAINERLVLEGISVNEVVAEGGIAKKSDYVMQTLCDILGMPVKVTGSDQSCALGAAMFAAVVAGRYSKISEAQRHMTSGFSKEFKPDMSKKKIYDKLFAKYNSF